MDYGGESVWYGKERGEMRGRRARGELGVAFVGCSLTPACGVPRLARSARSGAANRCTPVTRPMHFTQQ